MRFSIQNRPNVTRTAKHHLHVKHGKEAACKKTDQCLVDDILVDNI